MNTCIYSHLLPDGIQMAPQKVSLNASACLFYGAEVLTISLAELASIYMKN